MAAFNRCKLSLLLALSTSNVLFKCTHSYGKTFNFSTKTPYEWVAKLPSDKIHADNACRSISITYLSRQCTPIHAHVIYRHATRFPSGNKVKTMTDVLTKLQHIRSCQIKELRCNFIESDDKQISVKGIQEMIDFGVRFGQDYCDMLSHLGPDAVRFVSSSKSRSFKSAESFRQGLYSSLGWSDINLYSTPVHIDDKMLRYFDKCFKYTHHLNAHTSGVPSYLQEHNKFMNGPEMTYVTKSIAEKIKIPQTTITKEEMYAMYYIGAFDYVFYNDTRLIGLFNKDHLDILEYLDDLKHYWKKAYGFKINYLITCGLVKQIYNECNDVISQFTNNQPHQAAAFQFGHAETVIPLLAAFGLYKDDVPLRADNYHLHHNRAFRSSHMSPFSANIAFVLHYCDRGGGGVQDNDFFMRILVNERPVSLPDCDELCPFTTWTSKIQYLLDMDFDTYCSVRSDEL